MAKKFENFKQMITDLSESENFNKKLHQEIMKRQLVKYLFFLRCKENLTQKDLADRIKSSQSRISKIEGSYDEDLTLKDITDVAGALGLIVELGFKSKNMRIVDQLNHHTQCIGVCLNQLANICKDDESMEKGLLETMQKTFSTMLTGFTESLSKLKIVREKILQVPDEKMFLSIASSEDNPFQACLPPK